MEDSDGWKDPTYLDAIRLDSDEAIEQSANYFTARSSTPPPWKSNIRLLGSHIDEELMFNVLS